MTDWNSSKRGKTTEGKMVKLYGLAKNTYEQEKKINNAMNKFTTILTL